MINLSNGIFKGILFTFMFSCVRQALLVHFNFTSCEIFFVEKTAEKKHISKVFYYKIVVKAIFRLNLPT